MAGYFVQTSCYFLIKLGIFYFVQAFYDVTQVRESTFGIAAFYKIREYYRKAKELSFFTLWWATVQVDCHRMYLSTYLLLFDKCQYCSLHSSTYMIMSDKYQSDKIVNNKLWDLK